MSRKLMYLLGSVIAFTACYIIVAMTTYVNVGRRKLFYMNGLDSFYRDIGMRGLDRDMLIHQRLRVQRSYEEMLTGESKKRHDEDTSQNTENIKLPEHKIGVFENPDRHLSNDTKQNSLVRHKNSLEKLAAEKRWRESYFKLRESRVNPFDFEFLESGETICDRNLKPYLVILCLTKFFDVETRQAIRETWGSVAVTKRWPGIQGELPVVKLVFLFGSHDNSLVKRTIIEDEKNRFGDVIVADFKDSYLNLTLKVMMGLKWVSNYCPEARFVVKIDQDTFLHVLNLFNYLQFIPIPPEGFIVGYVNVDPKVLRNGRWGVDRKTFALSTYPNYTNGNCYVISGNAVSKMLEAAERMPYIWVEDAFLTGIVRQVLGVKIIDHKGFTKWNDKPPRLCGFHNGVRIAATNTDNDRKRNLWKAFTYVNLKNCYDIKKHVETYQNFT